jgi:hypothetical protein
MVCHPEVSTNRLMMFRAGGLRKIFRLKRKEVTGSRVENFTN